MLLKIALGMWLLSGVETMTRYNTGHYFHYFVDD